MIVWLLTKLCIVDNFHLRAATRGVYINPTCIHKAHWTVEWLVLKCGNSCIISPAVFWTVNNTIDPTRIARTWPRGWSVVLFTSCYLANNDKHIISMPSNIWNHGMCSEEISGHWRFIGQRAYKHETNLAQQQQRSRRSGIDVPKNWLYLLDRLICLVCSSKTI